MVLSLEQEYTEEGFVWPKVEVSEVSFALKPELFQVHLEGDLPVYKNRRFEQAVQKWLTDSLTARETDFKIAAQLSEREIMASFAFKKELGDSTAHSSLSEALSLDGDNVLMSYHTEFEGKDLDHMKGGMRKIRPEFSSEPEFFRDVQITYDENYINWQLFRMFTGDKTFSLTETLLYYWPETWPAAPQTVRVLMSALPWSSIFLDITRKFSPQQQVDLRCGFGKNFLSKGNLDENKVSRVRLEDNGRVNLDLHFGCNILAFKNDKSDME